MAKLFLLAVKPGFTHGFQGWFLVAEILVCHGAESGERRARRRSKLIGPLLLVLSSMPSSSPPAKPLTLMLTDGREGLRQHLAYDAVWADGTQQPSGGLR